MRQKIKLLLEQETGGGQEKIPLCATLKVQIDGKTLCRTQKNRPKFRFLGRRTPKKYFWLVLL